MCIWFYEDRSPLSPIITGLSCAEAGVYADIGVKFMSKDNIRPITMEHIQPVTALFITSSFLHIGNFRNV